MLGRRIRLVVRIIAYVIGGLLVVFAITLGLLHWMNPRPHKAPRWTAGAQMPQARGEMASAIVGPHMVVAGGLYGVGRTSNAVHVYDINRNEWTRTRSLPAARHHAAAAGLGRYVYVSGGAPSATDWTPMDTLWRAIPGFPWKPFARMPEGRQGHAMVAFGGRLYVIGGVGRTDRTLIYDPAYDRWSAGSPLPFGRDHLRAVAWGGEIWAVGGRTGSPTTRVDIYDPHTDGWRPGPPLPAPMSAMAIGILDDGLHVVGGEDPGLFGGHIIKAHFVLSAGGKRWRRSSHEMLPVHGAAYAVRSGQLIVAGGAARPGLLSTISWTPVTQSFRPQGFRIRLLSFNSATTSRLRDDGLGYADLEPTDE